MSRRSRAGLVAFDEIEAIATVDVRPVRGNRFTAFIALVTAAALVGAGFAAMGYPALLAASAGVARASDFWDSLPTILPTSALPQHTILLDKNGVEFARFYSENRVDIPFKQINPTFTNALVATEDARFYQHSGVDLAGIARAAVENLRGGAQQGASTITQQLVQNILISNATTAAQKEVAVGSTYNSKIREIKYAVSLEKTMSKRDILTEYSNAVFLGNRAYGVESAAKTYFNTTASQLTVPQSAMLVAMLKSPVQYDPFVHPAAAKERRDTVIGRMLAAKYITKTAASAAVASPLALVSGSIASGCGSSAYPYYCALVRDEILSNPAFGATAEARAETLRRGGLTLTTALDPAAMVAAQNATTSALGNDNRVAAGTAVVQPGTGHISAVAQNRTWDQTQLIYAKSVFQPGSAMKAITLATALEQGIPLTTKFYANGPYTSTSLDSPPSGFHNDGGERAGTIDASTAIKQSVNIYFVKLIEKTGVLPVADMAKRLGINSLPKMSGREASLTLGTFDVSPLDMATVYATFASGGVQCKPIAIISGVASTGKNVVTSDADCHQEIDSSVAAQMDSVLGGPLTPGGTLGGVGGLPGRAAGAKTGTTDNNSANWTVGITPQFATAVWVGDPRGGQAHPLKNVTAFGRTFGATFGSSIAGPIWKNIMAAIHQGLPAQAFPVANGTAIRAATIRQIPDVRGLTVRAAAAELVSAGFIVKISAKTAPTDSINRPNTVASQNPASGTKVSAADATVTLTLSHGSDTNVKVPRK